MIGRWGQSIPEEEVDKPKGFDDFELRLGDVMRGERATMGKSLLDVQRELKIKAAFISAIENSDPSAFETPGFIAGFVRSYARYLNLDPDWAFARFSEESGFETVHGMSAEALPARKSREERLSVRNPADALAQPSVPFQPARESVLSQFEPRAIGSILVLVALIAGLGYGGWAVLQEVQRVDLVPVDQAPTVAADLNPAAAASPSADVMAVLAPPSTDALERLYRPQALDVPVLVARDAPIATLNPNAQGVFAEGPVADGLPQVGGIQVNDGPVPEVTLLAVAPTWVRVQTPNQSVIFEKVLEPGEEYIIPVTEETPTLRAGNSGSLYFRVNGELVGPAGQGTSTVQDVRLASTDLSAAYAPANPLEDSALFDLLEELGSPVVLPRPVAALIPELSDAQVALVSTEDSWVRVRDAGGAVAFEGIIPPGDVQLLPDGLNAPTLRAGNSGALFFRVGDLFFGPAGPAASTARNVDMTPDGIKAAYPLVAPETLGFAAN